ncbi:drug/metabolite transporter (DMT)-like permease [Pseudoxanthomonas japonensis]|uniref:DMT family transporter n=1 Tax=Pseudoxanthomonas japonensis TaxID=69284 RepID=UPI00285648B2|nr:DMT family transporter [Pseudoxanthomonas japonensis]MDR7069221.1 drug/metabolite transporter (DMT)-like permease [Pseudoxanthomonas japonensis]
MAVTPPRAVERDWRTPMELLVLGAIWGSSFLFMRIAANPFGPFALVEVRLALGALVLLPFLWRERAHFRASMWPKLAIIGAINSAIPFLLFAWAAQRSPAAIGAICNAMTVLFAAMVGFLFFGQKIGLRRSLALLVGFIGVVVLATSKAGGLSVGGAVIAGSTAALLYGVGVNLVRKHLAGIPPAAAAAATLSCAALLVLLFAATHWPTHAIGAGPWAAAITIGVLCTGYAFLLYYRLIHRIGPARAATVTYLVPLFGAGFAWLFLNEPVTPAMLAAGALILGSVAVSQRAA